VPQVPPAQASEQHSAVLAHAPPVAAHAARRQVPAAQRPEQQSPLAEQVAPSATHTTGATQRPALQVVPEQQSAWAEHASSRRLAGAAPAGAEHLPAALAGRRRRRVPARCSRAWWWATRGTRPRRSTSRSRSTRRRAPRTSGRDRPAGRGHPSAALGRPSAGRARPSGERGRRPGERASTGGVGTSTGGVGTSTGGVGTSSGGVGTSIGGAGTSIGGAGTSIGGAGTSTGVVGTSTGAAPVSVVEAVSRGAVGTSLAASTAASRSTRSPVPSGLPQPTASEAATARTWWTSRERRGEEFMPRGCFPQGTPDGRGTGGVLRQPPCVT
jgi:hypothetical protein